MAVKISGVDLSADTTANIGQAGSSGGTYTVHILNRGDLLRRPLGFAVKPERQVTVQIFPRCADKAGVGTHWITLDPALRNK